LTLPDVLRETHYGDTVHSNYRDRTCVIVAAGVIAGATNQNVKVASAFVEAITQIATGAGKTKRRAGLIASRRSWARQKERNHD
jgi:hypothetical protein